MNTFAEGLTDLNEACVDPNDGFGELITLLSGDVPAIVDLPVGYRLESRDRGSTSGARLALEHQANPRIHMRNEHAAGSKEADPVTVRNVEYLVVRIFADGAGMTTADLMLPGQELGVAPQYNQWR